VNVDDAPSDDDLPLNEPPAFSKPNVGGTRRPAERARGSESIFGIAACVDPTSVREVVAKQRCHLIVSPGSG